jgi:hypothetical protein
MKTYKQFTIDEGWKDYIPSMPSMKDVYATGLNYADTISGGTYKDYIRPGIDYAVKNTAHKLGYGKGTTFEKEKKQEYEKLAKAEKESPKASAVGDIAAYATMVGMPYLRLSLADKAMKANEAGAKTAAVAKGLRTIIGR